MMKRLEDEEINQELCGYVSLDNLQSFFLVAGAGAGKTQSLVNTLQHLQRKYGEELRQAGKKIAVITYTRAASEEIERRINYDSVFHISTIHSFAWRLIRTYQRDIKEYMKHKAEQKFKEIEIEISEKGSTKARELKKERYSKKVSNAENVKRYNYSPDVSISSGKSALTHNDVENILEYFIKSNEVFQRIIMQKYPVILIDECQDTKKELMAAFLELEKKEKNFCLGLFGDMMQRIYLSGMSDLESAVGDWNNKPKKLMNWRSQERIVIL
jgi:DNA helicase II / ATP-dependent DNA helicase PcrA